MRSRTLAQSLPPQYHALGVGSLPFEDPVEAVEFILSREWIVPFWPELPNASASELMVERSGRVYEEGWSGYEPSEALGLFELSRRLSEIDAPIPIVKGQLCGPLTRAVYLKRGISHPSLQAAAKACLLEMEWQREMLNCEEFIAVLDEPCLERWSEYDDRERQWILEALSYLYVRANESGFYLGLHSCGAFQRVFLQIPIDLLSFDTTLSSSPDPFGESLLEDWAKRLREGLVVAPGVFPAVAEGVDSKLIDSGVARAREIRSILTTLSDEDTVPILLSASCGHLSSKREWVLKLYESDWLIGEEDES